MRGGRIGLPRGRFLELGSTPLVMGIVNCTPDSFFAGSRAASVQDACERALAMEAAGAAIVDLGGESTRPGSDYVSEAEEIERVLPVVMAIRERSGLPISVDTRKAAVARLALEAGADIVNDISALEDDPAMAGLAAASGAALVLMHKRGEPKTMQAAPDYADAVAEVRGYLGRRAELALAAGVPRDRIVLDPGFGFGKRYEDNLDLLIHLAEISGAGYPVLVGLSRKSFLGTATGRGVGERLAATAAAQTVAMLSGAAIVRAHDVAEALDAARLVGALKARA
jgi:dihydropteroate synthase